MLISRELSLLGYLFGQTFFVLLPFALVFHEFVNLGLVLKWSIVVFELCVEYLVVNHCLQWITEVFLALPSQL